LPQSINRQTAATHRIPRATALAAVLFLAATAAFSQQPALRPIAAAASSASSDDAKPATRITPEQAKKLFSLVDELIKYSSIETGLPVKSNVKRQLTTRTAVEAYLTEKFNDDQDAKRLQRDEIVLKKFGLLDRDFDLKPFLLALLKEQIEAYYDSKTKTVNMLDWIDVEEQKPVLAHELTHALQDQHSDLEKWDDQTPDDVSTNESGDNEHLAKDEMDTARDAVAEGQATAVMMDYMLKPAGKSLIKDPEVMDVLKQQMTGSDNSPVMARAPLLLSESLLFPYREGLSFEQDLWMDQGQAAAFANVLDNPPTSSWEIINPREYEKRHTPAVPLLPDIHPLVDKLYKPYDIGQVGQLDVHILTALFGGDNAARNLTPAWNGGLYWAGQLRTAKTPAELGSTKSLALLYLAAWRNAASAQNFAKLYADSLGRKYSGLKVDAAAKSSIPDDGKSPRNISEEQVFTTSEGPVVITTRGKLVFIAESFPLDIARKLTDLVLEAQGTGEMKMAMSPPAPGLFTPSGRKPGAPSMRHLSVAWVGNDQLNIVPQAPLNPDQSSETGNSPSGNLVRFFSNAGVMKSVVDAALRTAAQRH
jgi:hypothetical protein